MRRIAIIGAGLSGLVLAQRLRDIDKSALLSARFLPLAIAAETKLLEN